MGILKLCMTETIADLQWIEAQSTAQIYDWKVNEIRQVNVQDSETMALIQVGLLRVVDETTRALFPPPAMNQNGSGKGCGCG